MPAPRYLYAHIQLSDLVSFILCLCTQEKSGCLHVVHQYGSCQQVGGVCSHHSGMCMSEPNHCLVLASTTNDRHRSSFQPAPSDSASSYLPHGSGITVIRPPSRYRQRGPAAAQQFLEPLASSPSSDAPTTTSTRGCTSRL